MAVRSVFSWMVLAMGLAGYAALAQERGRAPAADSSGVTLRLEPHAGRTRFELGDPITLDVVASAAAPGYAIFTDTNEFNAPQELVNVSPAQGWFRSQGQASGGSREDLGGDPVRIAVVLNRSIVFEQPGHYEVTVTWRVAPRGIVGSTLCCRDIAESVTSNAVTIDLLQRDEHEESELVARLSRVVDARPERGFSEEWQKQHAVLLDEMQQLLRARSTDSQRMKSLSDKLGAENAEELARLDRLKATRREAALRLSYLRGDDATRAKVRALLADKEEGTDDIGLIMLRGLAHSRNLQLQAQLLQAAWEDVGRVPTGLLQSGLQQSKAFVQHKTFELYYSHGVPGRMLPHAEMVEEYRRELGELTATLPRRTGTNRQRTAYFLVMEGGGLNPEDGVRVRAVIAEEFAGMSLSSRTMLLQSRWKELCGPALPRTSEALEAACAAASSDPKR